MYYKCKSVMRLQMNRLYSFFFFSFFYDYKKYLQKYLWVFFRYFAQVRLDCCASIVLGVGGAPRVYKELWRQQVGEVGIAIWNHWLASADFVLERTTPIATGKDHLQAPLVFPFQSFFVFSGLGLKCGDFILCHPNV